MPAISPDTIAGFANICPSQLHVLAERFEIMISHFTPSSSAAIASSVESKGVVDGDINEYSMRLQCHYSCQGDWGQMRVALK